MELLLVIAWTALFIFLIRKLSFFECEGTARRYIIGVFILKIIAGSAMGLIYTHYYTERKDADIYKYFDDSRVLFNTVQTDPAGFIKMFTGIGSEEEQLEVYYDQMNHWYNKESFYHDNRTMIRLNTLFRFFSLGYYYVHTVFICFISLIGLTALYKVFVSEIKNKTRELFAAVFLLPSVLFWGSGVLKDGLLITALGTLLYSFHQLITGQKSYRAAAIFLVSVLLLLAVKVYVLVFVLPGLAAWWWHSKSERYGGIKFILVYSAFFLVLISLTSIRGINLIPELICEKQKGFILLAEANKAGSLISIPLLEPTWGNIIQQVPGAVLRVIFRPHILDSRSPFILLAAIENTAILLFFLTSILRFIQKRNMPSSGIFWFSLFFVGLIFAITGLVTPVMGAMVRYKIIALPFIIVLIISFQGQRRLA